MNPCPCGYYQVPNADKDCTCNTQQISRYKKKLSGPLLDRIDLYIDVSPVKFDDLSSKEKSESSEEILRRVQKARDIQTKRFQEAGLNISSNAEMSVEDVKVFCVLPKDAENLLRMAMKQFNLSARAYHRIIKVARSIADLAGEDHIMSPHIAEALQYRRKGDE